MKSLVGQR